MRDRAVKRGPRPGHFPLGKSGHTARQPDSPPLWAAESLANRVSKVPTKAAICFLIRKESYPHRYERDVTAVTFVVLPEKR